MTAVETLPASAGKITRLSDVRAYVLGGHARFTLVSNATNERKTYRVRERQDGARQTGEPRAYFVDLLVGPDNTADYKYLAFLWAQQDAGDRAPALRTKYNKDGWGEEAYRALSWLTFILNVARNCGPEASAKSDEAFNRQAEFYHLGTCARCGRDLTTPESVARGLGPTCAGEV